VINNYGVTDTDLLKIGETLQVPPRDGLIYSVRPDETLEIIARRYGVQPAAILGEPVNALTAPDLIRVGQSLFIPGAKVVIPAPIATPSAIATLRATVPATATAASPAARIATAVPVLTPTIPARPAGSSGPAAPVASSRPAAGGWAWPISGPLSSYFGPSHPLGIDIDLYGRAGAPVVAARGGTVTVAGGNPCCSYGYYVEIDHGDGTSSLYAHFQSPPPVRVGQRVEQGTVVGYAGTTGYSTGVHLHFEIRVAGNPRDPLSYLP
jgi:murein DD-endopeptidase MepM/ murein hydrolase activator NlpD